MTRAIVWKLEESTQKYGHRAWLEFQKVLLQMNLLIQKKLIVSMNIHSNMMKLTLD